MKRRHRSHPKLILAILLAIGSAALGHRASEEEQVRAAAHSAEKHATAPRSAPLARLN